MVDSFSRPGRNATGMYVLVNALVAKQLEVLREVVPGATTVAFIDNPTNPFSELRLREIQEAALALGVKLKRIRVSREHDLDTTFASLLEQRASAVLIAPDPFLTSRRDQIVALTERHAVPAIAPFRENAMAGGLMRYGSSLTDAYRGNVTCPELDTEIEPFESSVMMMTWVGLASMAERNTVSGVSSSIRKCPSVFWVGPIRQLYVGTDRSWPTGRIAIPGVCERVTRSGDPTRTSSGSPSARRDRRAKANFLPWGHGQRPIARRPMPEHAET